MDDEDIEQKYASRIAFDEQPVSIPKIYIPTLVDMLGTDGFSKRECKLILRRSDKHKNVGNVDSIRERGQMIMLIKTGKGKCIGGYIKEKIPKIKFDMYEIDTEIKLLNKIKKNKVIYGDFIKQNIKKKYKTIIGNPPYIKTKKGNLYIDFIEKCYNLLDNNGELIFIIPSDFLKLTCASKLLNIMSNNIIKKSK